MAKVDYKRVNEISTKYGVGLPRLGGSRLLSRQRDDELGEIRSSISNYQNRIKATGTEVPEPNKALSSLVKVLQVLDAPRNALWNAVEDSVSGENSFGQGFMEGLKYEEEYTGADLAKDMFGEPQTRAGKIGTGVAGFLFEVVGDPLNYVSFGAGSLAKGLFTGTTKELTQEGAEAMAKALTRGLPTIDDAIRYAREAAEKGAVKGSDNIAKMADQFLKDEYAKIFDKEVVGQRFEELIAKVADSNASKNETIKAFLEDTFDEIPFDSAVKSMPNVRPDDDFLRELYDDLDEYIPNDVGSPFMDYLPEGTDLAKVSEAYDEIVRKPVVDAIAQGMLDADAARIASEAGLRIGPRIIKTQNDMMKMGAKAREAIQRISPKLDSGIKLLDDRLSGIFNPYYITGLTKEENAILKSLKILRKGQKSVADEMIIDTAKQFHRAMDGLDDATREADLSSILRWLEGEKTVKLNDRTKPIAENMRDLFKEMGVKESQAGSVARNLIDSYYPHVQNWDNANLGRTIRTAGVTSRMRMFNPNALAREYSGNFLEAQKQMLFKTAKPQAKQEAFATVQQAIDELGDEALTRGLKITPDFMSENTVKFIDNNFPEIWDDLKAAGGIDDWFEANPIRAFVTRGLRSNKIIADQAFLGDIAEQFGTKVNKDNMATLLSQGQEIVVPRTFFNLWKINPKQALEADNIGINAAGALEEGLKSQDSELVSIVRRIVENTDGQHFVSVRPNDFQALVEYIPLNAYALPSGVRETVNGMSQKQINAGIETVGSIIDRFYTVWKPTVTGLRGDYHLRNLMGSTWMNMMDVGTKTFDPSITKGAKELLGSAKGKLELAGKEIDLDTLRNGFTESGAKATQMSAGHSNLEQTLKGQVETVFDEANPIKTGTKEFIRKIDKTKPVRSTASAVVGVGKEVGNVIEDKVRAVNFLANVEASLERGSSLGQAMREAGEHVRKWHFDYTELTEAERKIFKRIVPFYSWMRKNIPLQLETFLNDHRPVKALERFKVNMEKAGGVSDEDQPSWFRDSTPIPLGLGADGKMKYINASLPSADLGNLDDPKQLLLNPINPLFKVPVELMTNQNFLTGAPITSNDYQKKQDYLNYMLRQFGTFRDAATAFQGYDSEGRAVAQEYLPGNRVHVPLVKSYDENEGAVDAAYQYRRQLQNLIQYLKEMGIDVPDNADISDMQRLLAQVQQ
jgi:hypothetical protein